MNPWQFACVCFVGPILFGWILQQVLKPLLHELQQTQKVIAFQVSELRKDLRIRADEASRAAYFDRYGTYPDHWKNSVTAEEKPATEEGQAKEFPR